MTLKEIIASDYQNVMLNTDEHAESAVYTDTDDSETTFAVLAQREVVERESVDSGMEIPHIIEIALSTEDIASPAISDKVTGKPFVTLEDSHGTSVDWNIRGVMVSQDGRAVLRLYRREVTEKSARGHRLERT